MTVEEYMETCQSCEALIRQLRLEEAHLILTTTLAQESVIEEVASLAFDISDKRQVWFKEACPRALQMLDSQLPRTAEEQISVAYAILYEQTIV